MTVSALDDPLVSLQSSLESAQNSLPAASTIAPPHSGISLFDTKNELFLSYLENLTFLILFKLRDLKSPAQSTNGDARSPNGESDIPATVVQTLVELRLYLERGVRPLESRLRYQLDKVVRAAADADAATAANGAVNTRSRADSTDGDAIAMPAVDPLSFRPNPAAFRRPPAPAPALEEQEKPEAYRPPRIAPTLPPDFDSARRPPRERRPQRSALLEEFIEDELSGAPAARASIGSAMDRAGQRQRTAKERREEAERTQFEEENLTRLPGKGGKKGKRGRERDGWGGEEWSGLGRGAERLLEMTGGEGRKKRKAEGESRSAGRMGEKWETKVRRAEAKKRKKSN